MMSSRSGTGARRLSLAAALLVAMGIALVPVSQNVAHAAPVSTLCTNATYVDGSSSSAKKKNFGSSPDMGVAGTVKNAFIECAVTNVPAGESVLTARLHVYSRAVNTNHTVRLHKQPTAWNEATVNWNTLHTFDPAVLSSANGNPTASGDTLLLDAPTVTGNGTWRFALSSDNTATQFYGSDDYATPTDRPSLEITTGVPPTTTTPPPPTTTTTPPPPTTTTTPPPPAGPVPTGVPGNWTLSFADEFNGTALDTTKWMPYWYVDGGVQNNVPTRASNVSVANGELKLILSDANNGASINTDISSGYKFPVGSCTEARVFFPGSETTAEKIYNFPAWWVAPVMNTWPSAGEHDIAEGLGGELTVNYHSPSGAHNFGAIPGDWNNAFHVYTVCRKTASADVYWDGALVKSYPTDDNGLPEILIVNIGRSNSRTPVLGDAGAIRVDYVRAWAPA